MHIVKVTTPFKMVLSAGVVTEGGSTAFSSDKPLEIFDFDVGEYDIHIENDRNITMFNNEQDFYLDVKRDNTFIRKHFECMLGSIQVFKVTD